MLWTSFMLSHLWTDHLAHLPVLPTSLPCSGMLTPVGNWWGTYITGSAATGGARGDDDGEGKEDEERVWAVKAPSDDEEMDLEQESRGNKPMVTKDNSKWCPSATSLTLTYLCCGLRPCRTSPLPSHTCRHSEEEEEAHQHAGPMSALSLNGPGKMPGWRLQSKEKPGQVAHADNHQEGLGHPGKLNAAPTHMVPLPPTADHSARTERPTMLHRCVLQVCLGTLPDQQVRH